MCDYDDLVVELTMLSIENKSAYFRQSPNSPLPSKKGDTKHSPRTLLDAYRLIVAEAATLYETFLRASLMGICECRWKHDVFFTNNSDTAFSSMFECLVADMTTSAAFDWQARVCDTVCTEMVSHIADVYGAAFQYGSGAILECMSAVLGAHVVTEGPVGMLCAKVLCAAFQHATGMGPRFSFYTGPMKHVKNFLAVALYSAQHVRVFAAALPTFVKRGNSERGYIGSTIAARCAIDLARGETVDRARELLDALFDLPDLSCSFIDDIYGRLDHQLYLEAKEKDAEVTAENDDDDGYEEEDDEEEKDKKDKKDLEAHWALLSPWMKHAGFSFLFSDEDDEDDTETS
jgi:hypothetical protein